MKKGDTMAQSLIDTINSFSSFKFDADKNRVVSLEDYEGTDVEEFLDIQYLLDCNKVMYSFQKNFEIQIISRKK